MENSTVHQKTLHRYPVWNRTVRIFHWVNVITILGLIFVGLAIFFNKELGVSPEGKILLKTIHVYIGYIFALNLTWRIIGLFSNNKYASWRAVLPFGKKHRESLKSYVKATKASNSPNYLGHNPLGRIMVALLFTLLSTQAITGLVLAGTDLYFPPFGNTVAEWVATTDEMGNKVMDIRAGSKENVDPEAYKEMREFRKPFITVHVYAFYLLLIAIFLHILGVVVSEFKERSGLVSAMFTGEKVFSKKPIDSDD